MAVKTPAYCEWSVLSTGYQFIGVVFYNEHKVYSSRRKVVVVLMIFEIKALSVNTKTRNILDISHLIFEIILSTIQKSSSKWNTCFKLIQQAPISVLHVDNCSLDNSEMEFRDENTGFDAKIYVGWQCTGFHR